MLREQVEARLRALAVNDQPVFKTIESATNLDSVIKGNRIAADTAFIVPMADRGAPQELTTMRFQQHIQATVGVVIACRNINDTFGKDAIERLEYLKKLVRKHLLGWEPDGMETLLFDQGRIVSFSASAAFWLEQYRCRYTFRG